jgi:hypothetical protein
MALALLGAFAAGCGASSGPADSGGNQGIVEGTFAVSVQNGQGGNPTLQIVGGYVTSSPAGIDCGGAARAACDFEFPLGTAVTLTAVPDAGKELIGWAGDCFGLENTCSLSGNAAKYVVAQFGTAADRAVHPNWSDPAAHAPQLWDAFNKVSGAWACTSCHGQSLTGQGIAVSCAGCHGSNQKVAKLEGCATCHTAGSYGTPPAVHTRKGKILASASAVSVNGADLEFTVNVTLDGAGVADMLTNTPTIYRYRQNSALATATVIAPFERLSVAANTGYTIANLGNGDSTASRSSAAWRSSARRTRRLQPGSATGSRSAASTPRTPPGRRSSPTPTLPPATSSATRPASTATQSRCSVTARRTVSSTTAPTRTASRRAWSATRVPRPPPAAPAATA